MKTYSLKIATEEDIGYVVDLCRQFYEDTEISQVTEFDEVKVYSLILSIISGDKTKGIVILSPHGFIIGIEEPALFSSETMTHELAWWVHKDHRMSREGLELINAYEYWSKFIVKAKKCSMSMLSDSPPLKRLYERRGYKFAEQAFIKDN